MTFLRTKQAPKPNPALLYGVATMKILGGYLYMIRITERGFAEVSLT